MKVFLLLVVALVTVFTTAVFAQSANSAFRKPVQKSNAVYGVSFVNASLKPGSGASRSSAKSIPQYGTNLKAGLFVNSNLVLGLNVNAYNGAAAGVSSKSYSGGGFARYYFGKMVNSQGSQTRVRCFTEAGGDLAKGAIITSQNADGQQRIPFTNGSVFLMPGIDLFLNRNVAIEGGCVFRHRLGSESLHFDNNTLGLTIGVQFFPGW